MLGLVGLQQQAMILDVCCVFFGGHHRLNVRVPRRCIWAGGVAESWSTRHGIPYCKAKEILAAVWAFFEVTWILVAVGCRRKPINKLNCVLFWISGWHLMWSLTNYMTSYAYRWKALGSPLAMTCWLTFLKRSVLDRTDAVPSSVPLAFHSREQNRWCVLFPGLSDYDVLFPNYSAYDLNQDANKRPKKAGKVMFTLTTGASRVWIVRGSTYISGYESLLLHSIPVTQQAAENMRCTQVQVHMHQNSCNCFLAGNSMHCANIGACLMVCLMFAQPGTSWKKLGSHCHQSFEQLVTCFCSIFWIGLATMTVCLRILS